MRKMSVLERCLYWKGVCIRKMFLLERRLLERCLYWGDVCIGRCLY